MEIPLSERCGDRAKIAEAAREILNFLRSNNVREAADLFPLRRRIEEKEKGVQIGFAPSGGLTHAHTISYCEYPKGVPLEVKINPTLGYTVIAMKGQFPAAPEHYETWIQDPFGNILYFRRIPATISAVLSELERLAGVEDKQQP